ncbi:hypothetical protein P8452_05262 [Trifolium repens]|nr:hypothetical protein P8452_05262 [Trifolium repens]
MSFSSHLPQNTHFDANLMLCIFANIFISSLFSALSSSHSQRKVHKPSNEHTTATKFNLGFLPFIKIRGKEEWVRSISQEYIHSLMICSKLPQTKDFIHCIKCFSYISK